MTHPVTLDALLDLVSPELHARIPAGLEPGVYVAHDGSPIEVGVVLRRLDGTLRVDLSDGDTTWLGYSVESAAWEAQRLDFWRGGWST